ncbi:hypothetical protein NRIC_32140 [Enterococcus florum]|uniref:Major facilitator superfamily (MFS) profile domain-containing protein n=1 Tax=Enterococcus florum TaxID=2480627 RepID=A0A4P5PR02_9ENTE|nr:MFS transporter [Enterococcus florum]GCF95323.1 hypothetical protein NRIC_32140 [Enterococcus florum]
MKKQQSLQLNLRYISLQVPYWMGYSILATFASVFLLAKEFNNGQIGLILSAANLLATVAQPFLASFADRMQRWTLSQLSAAMAAVLVLLSTALLVIFNHYLLIAVLYVLLYTCLILLQPMTISIGTFFISRGYSLNFGVARGLGSLAFALASAGTGLLIERFSVNVVLYALIGIFAFFAVATRFLDTRKTAGTYSLSVNEEEQMEELVLEDPCSLPVFVRRYKRFMGLIVGVACLFVFHTIVNSYMYQIMQPLGGTEANVGSSLSIAALSELPTMFLFTWLMSRFKLKSLIRLAAVFFTIKAVLILAAPNILLINVAQTLQMIGFALHTTASVYYTSKIIPKRDLIKGQTLMSTANTIGGIVGSFLGGQLLNSFSVSVMLLAGTLISAIGTILVFLMAEE